MNKSNIIAFALGLVIGSGATFLYFKNKYEIVTEVEVPEEMPEDENQEEHSESSNEDVMNFAKNKPPIMQFVSSDTLSQDYPKVDYFDYTKMYKGEPADRPEDEETNEEPVKEENDIPDMVDSIMLSGVKIIDSTEFYSDGLEHFTFYKHPDGTYRDDNYELYDLNDFTGVVGLEEFIAVENKDELFLRIESGDMDISIITLPEHVNTGGI